ncbi:endoplasmic reticulum protein [Mycena floridula]|nr:endoplasmic reticulum protein [Mycena floridula]
MDFLFLPLAQVVGASVDQVKLIFCLLVAYPLGSLFVRVPSSKPNLRHLFNVSVTLLFFFPILKLYSAFFQLLASVIVTYLLAKYDHSPGMPWKVFVFTMGHLLINHTIRYVYQYSYETLEVTGPQMVLTMKLTTFAWNVLDGRRPKEDLDAWQLSKRIVTFPSLLEFLGYAFYFPGMLVGPYLEYANYDDLVHERAFQNPEVKENKGRKLPSGRKRVAYRKMVEGLTFLGLFVVFGSKYNHSTVLTPGFVKLGWFSRIAALQVFGFLERTKYYALWTLTEGASILTGSGFTGFGPSGESLWNGAANVNPRLIEFTPNFKILLDSWNMKTNVWLRECVYKRVTAKGKKPGFRSSMLTFATSAIWHGVAAGYYLTFVLGGFITPAARLVRANVRPLLLPAAGEEPSIAKKIYDFLGVLVSVLMVNYATVPFMILNFQDSLVAWSRVGFYGHILIGGALVFFYSGGTQFFKGLQKSRGITSAKLPNGTSTPVTEKNFAIPPVDHLVLPKK